jgi:NarL family two-component system response regulator LiaR
MSAHAHPFDRPTRLALGAVAAREAALARSPRTGLAGTRTGWVSRGSRSRRPNEPTARIEPPITLALVGGGRLLREATAAMLGAQHGLRVLGAFGSADDFLLDRTQLPVVVLLDCEPCEPECLAAVEQLSAVRPACTVMMLCGEVSGETARCALEHGVGGIVLKSYTIREIHEAIDYVASGRTVMPVGWQRAIAELADRPPELTPRHNEVLRLIAAGRCNVAIATELGLSTNTVKSYVSELYERLGVRNRVEAAKRYAELGPRVDPSG